MTRSIVHINADSCKGCGLCISVCPKQVLDFDKTSFNSKGVYPAKVAKAEDCIGCTNCALMCPDGAICIEKEVE